MPASPNCPLRQSICARTVNSALGNVGHLADDAGVELLVDMPDEGVIAEVDPRRVERILRNLIANAIDHAERKPVRIRMAADDDTVAVTVRDYGVGLRPGEEKLVFSRFWRSDPSRVRRSGGTGLGLAISIEDARLHQGRLEAWGEPGQGRLLPADAAAGARPQGDHQPAADETRCAPNATDRPRCQQSARARRRERVKRLPGLLVRAGRRSSHCSPDAPACRIRRRRRRSAPSNGPPPQSLPKPTPGMEPDLLLREFLKATADPANRHLAARQFLTESASSELGRRR